ncbi:uncharacterized protein LOC130511195 [Raphanus sativus]|uniref:Uncharacterized protein LOC130511195 n=1 Tax=Raphanus sativus TaxID=3726 RepID=A0A9W3DJT8_RAPSA|nr:uncharacterized protein LOC130511195 [Raphanus sativus]
MASLSRFISRLSNKSHAFFETLKDPKDFQWTDKCEQALSDLKAYLTTPPLLSKPLEGEVLLLYLAISEHAVSAVLVREEGRKHHHIYYMSKSLLDAETRYSHLEKLALALVYAAPNLRPYFQAHQILVVTSFPIKAVLHKPEVSGRLAKWAIELGAYDVIFRPATAIISQVLADFVAEFSPAMLPALEQEVNLRDREGEKGEWTLYVDGSSNIPKEHNSQADALANLGSALETTSHMSIPLLVLQWPATEKEVEPEEVSVVDEGETWMTPIISYLRYETLPADQDESRKIRRQAARFFSEGKLYRRSFSGPYLRCLTPREAARILSGRSLKHAPVSNLPPENLKSPSSPWLFRKWGMDIMGKFPMAPGQKIFLLVVTDYFTKWVKAEALAKITDLQIRKFLWTNVITRIGTPHEIVTDNGPQFTSYNF